MTRWRKVRLGDALRVKHGYAFPGDDFSDDSKYPTLITPGNFAIGGGFKLSKPKTFTGKYPEEFELSAGNLILSMTDLSKDGATLGLPAVIPNRGTFLHNQRIGLVEVFGDSVVDARFLHYYLRTFEYRAHILGTASGSTVRHTSPSRICNFVATLPSVIEQGAIAEVLGALDDKIAANDHRAQLMLQLADAQFISGLERNIQTSMTVGELADQNVLEFGDGYRTKRVEHALPGMRILRAGDIRDGRVTLGGSDFVSNEFRRQIGPKASQAGDILLTTKGTVGRVAVVPPGLEQVVYSPQVCYFRVIDEAALDSGHLAAWFRSSDLQRQADTLMFKSDMAPYINLRDIRSLTLPVPVGNEQWKQGKIQRALLGGFQAACSENERLSRVRDELLPLLMSGKVRVPEAEKVVEEVV